MSYAPRAVRTLTQREVRAVLRATGKQRDDYRDHMLLALALGTGLRIHELVALDVGDVTTLRGGARQRVELRTFKRCGASHAPQTVVLADGLRKKVGQLLKWKKWRGESVAPDEPLFVSRLGRRLSVRRAREVWAHWRGELELSPALNFHTLRHTFCQRLYEKSGGNIRLVQKAARHANLETTTIYAEPSTDALVAAVQDLHT